MNADCESHPTAEDLIAYGLGLEPPAIREHVAACPACARFAKEMRIVKTGVESLPDEEIPASVERHILRWRKNRFRRMLLRVFGPPGAWARGPVLAGILAAIVIVFVFCLFFFVL